MMYNVVKNVKTAGNGANKRKNRGGRKAKMEEKGCRKREGGKKAKLDGRKESWDKKGQSEEKGYKNWDQKLLPTPLMCAQVWRQCVVNRGPAYLMSMKRRRQ
jgi:hypothetical protein